MLRVGVLLTAAWFLWDSSTTATAGPSCGTQTGNFESHDPMWGSGHSSCSGTYCVGETTYCRIGVNNCYWRCVLVNGQIQIQNVSCLQVFYGCPQPHPTCLTCG